MNVFETKTDEGRKAEFCCNLGQRELCVTVKTYPEDRGYNAGQTWVQVDEWVQSSPTYGFWHCIISSEQISDFTNDMEAVREAFRAQWGRLRRIVRSRAQFMELARNEKGGKRGYYTRLANDDLKRVPELARNWSLCKKIWKEITKL